MSRNKLSFAACFLLVEAIWFQFGGIGMSSLIFAEDVTVRQAACEIISMICLVGSAILFALPPVQPTKPVVE